MFTGIIQGKGRIIESRPAGGGMVFVLEADFELVDPEEGESIAVNGVCLTAKAIAGRRFAVDVSPESLARTTLGGLAHGKTVNLERALRLSDRLGGHLVSGHVDGVAPVLDVRPEGDFVRYTFGIPANLAKYIIEKGSIAVNGISLTVNSCDAQVFAVAIIPHTLKITTMGSLKKGDSVNIEVDLIGKYVEKLLAVKHEPGQVAESRLNPAFLAAHGYIR